MSKSTMFKSIVILLVPLLVTLSSAVRREGDNLEIKYLYDLFSKGITTNVFDNLEQIVINNNLTTKCKKSLQLLQNGIKTGDINSFRFIDSSAKVPSGLLDGTIASFGDYDQCIKIRTGELSGKHCTIKLRPTNVLVDQKSDLTLSLSKSTLLFNTFPMSIGICLPDACTTSDVSVIARKYLASEYLYVGGSMSAKDAIICDSADSVRFDVHKLSLAQIISLLYLATVMSLVFWSTILDFVLMNYWPGYKSSHWCAVFRTFSASYHTFKLLKASGGIQETENGHPKSGSEKSTRVSMVDNIRFMFAVVTAGLHSVGCAIEYRGMQKMLRMKPDFQSRFTEMSTQPFFNIVGIEAFFCIAGITTFLSSGLKVSKVPKDGKEEEIQKEISTLPFLQLIMFRFLRLFPGIMTLVAIDIAVWPVLGSLTGGAPLFTEVTNEVIKSCSDNWWKSALLINNWTDVNSICLIHTWYLSAEFQLFLIGVASLFVFKMKESAGVLFCYAMILIGMLVPGWRAFVDGQSPTLLLSDHNFEAMNAFTSVMYLPTINHLSPFFIGILISYYFKKGAIDMRVTLPKRAIGIFFFLCYTGVFYAPGYWNAYGNKVEPITAALYVIFHRVLWTLGFLASIMFMKDTNDMIFKKNDYATKTLNKNNNLIENSEKCNGSTMKSATLGNGYKLSKELVQICTMIFVTSSKLYFSLYLIHPLFIKYDWFSRRSMAEFSVFHNFVRSTYSLMFSMMAAFWFHLAFEAPFETMRKALKRKLTRAKEKLN